MTKDMIEELKRGLERELSAYVESIFARISKSVEDLQDVKDGVERAINSANNELVVAKSNLEYTRGLERSVVEAVKKIEPTRKVLLELLEEVESVKSKIKDSDKVLLSSKSAAGDVQKEIKDKQAELADVSKQIDKKMATVVPTMEELSKRSARIREMEIGLSTIEQRWKKLYAEQGANFKI